MRLIKVNLQNFTIEAEKLPALMELLEHAQFIESRYKDGCSFYTHSRQGVRIETVHSDEIWADEESALDAAAIRGDLSEEAMDKRAREMLLKDIRTPDNAQQVRSDFLEAARGLSDD